MIDNVSKNRGNVFKCLIMKVTNELFLSSYKKNPPPSD